MKKPSRLMPKFEHKPITITGWFVIMVFLSCIGYIIYKMPFVLILIPVFYLATCYENKKLEKKYKSILEKRNNESICSFSRSFDTKSIDTWVIRAVYEELQNYLSDISPDFPVKADDHLFNDLLLDEDDLDLDLVEQISERTGRSLGNYEDNLYYGKVTTVRNLVLFFNSQKQNGTTLQH